MQGTSKAAITTQSATNAKKAQCVVEVTASSGAKAGVQQKKKGLVQGKASLNQKQGAHKALKAKYHVQVGS